MPFLGPLIVAWVILGVAVMATYFLVVARADTQRSEPWESPFRQDREPAPSARWVRPRFGDPVTTEREEFTPVPIRAPRASNLPLYDMEDYPEDHWGSWETPVEQEEMAAPPTPAPRATAPRAPAPRAAARPSAAAPSRESDYDMENYPEDRWSSLSR